MRNLSIPQKAHTLSAIWVMLLIITGSGQCATTQQAPSDAWQISVTPYLWATRMKGDIQAGPIPKSSLDMKFSDILDTLDFGFMTAAEARKERWGILFDGMFMKVSDSAQMSRENIGLTVTGDLEIKQSMLAGAIAYRVIDGHMPFDVIGGLRYNRIDADGKVDARLTGLRSGTVDLSGTKDWVDPYIGVRIIIPLNQKWSLLGYIDIGGFGAGSDFTWQGMIGTNYAISQSVSAVFGYRYLKVDYDRDNFLYDIANDGLYLGATIHF